MEVSELGYCDGINDMQHPKQSGCKNWRPVPPAPAPAIPDRPGNGVFVNSIETTTEPIKRETVRITLPVERPVSSQLTRIEKDLESLGKTMQEHQLAQGRLIAALHDLRGDMGVLNTNNQSAMATLAKNLGDRLGVIEKGLATLSAGVVQGGELYAKHRAEWEQGETARKQRMADLTEQENMRWTQIFALVKGTGDAVAGEMRDLRKDIERDMQLICSWQVKATRKRKKTVRSKAKR